VCHGDDRRAAFDPLKGRDRIGMSCITVIHPDNTEAIVEPNTAIGKHVDFRLGERSDDRRTAALSAAIVVMVAQTAIASERSAKMRQLLRAGFGIGGVMRDEIAGVQNDVRPQRIRLLDDTGDKFFGDAPGAVQVRNLHQPRRLSQTGHVKTIEGRLDAVAFRHAAAERIRAKERDIPQQELTPSERLTIFDFRLLIFDLSSLLPSFQLSPFACAGLS
jgi:hypothetical protein